LERETFWFLKREERGRNRGEEKGRKGKKREEKEEKVRVGKKEEEKVS
jgi:hypothetical protein